jgi:CheY-like chemotaxis protein
MGKTLLLADDSVTIQKVVGISFASEDIAITTVDNGDDAIAKARELRPDMVLADVVMPGKNGYEVCEAIKADPSLQHIPVLLLTGTFEAFDEERAEQAGAAGHVSKPFEAQTLVERVKEILARAPAPPVAPVAPVAAPAEPRPPAADDSSFDFFEDNLDDFAMQPEAAAASADADPSERLSANLDLDGSDSAFSFGDDDLSGEALGSDLDAMLEPERPAMDAAAERTMAMDPGAALESPAAATMLDPSMLGASGAAREPERPGPDRLAFEAEPSRPAPNPASLSSRDMAQAAIIDPEVAADLAVSSSDLVPRPEQAPAAATQVIAEPVVTPEPMAPTAPSGDLPGPERGPVTDLLSSDLASAEASGAEQELMADTLPDGPDGPAPAWRETTPPAPPVEFASPPMEVAPPRVNVVTPPPRVPEPEAAPMLHVEPADLAPATPLPPEPMPAAPVRDAVPATNEPPPVAAPPGLGFPPESTRAAPEPLPPEPTFAAPEPRPQAPTPVAAPEVSAAPPASTVEPTFAAPEPRPQAPTPVAAPEIPAAPPASTLEPTFEPIPTIPTPEPPVELSPEPPSIPEPLPVPVSDDVPVEDMSGAVVDRVVEQVAPAMRAELHEMLERIAWESFGQISEQLVAQAIERVETIAWEVVPKLAEALVQEEIRRLKEGAEDA